MSAPRKSIKWKEVEKENIDGTVAVAVVARKEMSLPTRKYGKQFSESGDVAHSPTPLIVRNNQGPARIERTTSTITATTSLSAKSANKLRRTASTAYVSTRKRAMSSGSMSNSKSASQDDIYDLVAEEQDSVKTNTQVKRKASTYVPTKPIARKLSESVSGTQRAVIDDVNYLIEGCQSADATISQNSALDLLRLLSAPALERSASSPLPSTLSTTTSSTTAAPASSLWLLLRSSNSLSTFLDSLAQGCRSKEWMKSVFAALAYLSSFDDTNAQYFSNRAVSELIQISSEQSLRTTSDGTSNTDRLGMLDSTNGISSSGLQVRRKRPLKASNVANFTIPSSVLAYGDAEKALPTFCKSPNPDLLACHALASLCANSLVASHMVSLQSISEHIVPCIHSLVTSLMEENRKDSPKLDHTAFKCQLYKLSCFLRLMDAITLQLHSNSDSANIIGQFLSIENSQFPEILFALLQYLLKTNLGEGLLWASLSTSVFAGAAGTNHSLILSRLITPILRIFVNVTNKCDSGVLALLKPISLCDLIIPSQDEASGFRTETEVGLLLICKLLMVALAHPVVDAYLFPTLSNYSAGESDANVDENLDLSENLFDIITLSLGVLINACEINAEARKQILQFNPTTLPSFLGINLSHSSPIFPFLQFLVHLFARTSFQLQLFESSSNDPSLIDSPSNPNHRSNLSSAAICCRMAHSYLVLLIALLAEHDLETFTKIRAAFRQQNESKLTIAADHVSSSSSSSKHSDSFEQPVSSSSLPVISASLLTMNGVLRSLAEFALVQSEMNPEDASVEFIFHLIEKLKHRLEEIEEI